MSNQIMLNSCKYQLIIQDDGKVDIEWFNPILKKFQGFLHYDSIEEVRELSNNLVTLLECND